MASIAPTSAGVAPQFIVGFEYSRLRDIHQKYGGNRQSGISVSTVCKAIFIFTGKTGEQYGYKDDFNSANENLFHYSGEGQVGPMTFIKGNKALRDHALDGRAIHLFEALGKSKPVRYMGEFTSVSNSIVQGKDRNGAMRDIIVFDLLRVEAAQFDQARLPFAPRTKPTVSLRKLREDALAAVATSPPMASPQTVVRTLYERSQKLRDYVMAREAGLCRACGQPAPFTDSSGMPYLEAHHTTRVSDGGLDHPRFVAAICPTCHRRVHFGKDGGAVNDGLISWLKDNEPDD